MIKCESPCYGLEKICFDVTNPFPEGGEFRIVLVEASGALLEPGKQAAILRRKEKRKKRIKSKIDSGILRPETPPSPPPKLSEQLQMQKDGDDIFLSCHMWLLYLTSLTIVCKHSRHQILENKSGG